MSYFFYWRLYHSFLLTFNLFCLQARHKQSGNLVAIKQILEDENMMNREIHILQMLGENENLINLKESFYTGSPAAIGSE